MRALLPLLAVLLIPASASAATLGEVPPLELSGDGGECPHATGAPGEIAIETAAGVRFLQASRTGFARGPELTFPGTCRELVSAPTGAGVIVTAEDGDVIARVREPGGVWGVPQTLAKDTQETYLGGVRAAVSDRGDTLVVWSAADGGTVHFRAVRRAPGGAFGAVEEIPTAGDGNPIPAIAATGEAFLLTVSVRRSRPPVSAPVSVRMAPPGGPFGAPLQVAEGRWLSAPALAVAADGRALVAAWQGDTLVVSERAPGAGFAPAVAVGTASGQFVAAGAALAPGGAAAVGWQRIFAGDAVVVTRAAAGAFSAPVVVAQGEPPIPSSYDPFYFSESFFASFGELSSIVFVDEFGGTVALTGDGRAALATTLDVARGERLAPVMALGTVPLGGTAAISATTATRFGSDFTTAEPLILADGTPAVVWTEPSAESSRSRLHLAAEGVVERPDPPAPRIKVGQPRTRRLDTDRPLALPITCSAACEVRAIVESSIDDADGGLRLRRAGTGTLTIDNAESFAPPRLGPVRIRLTYGAHGALHPRERTITVRLKGLPAAPRALAVKARRDGEHVRVTWRVKEANDSGVFFVTGDDTRGWNGEPLVTRVIEAGEKQRTFSVTLRNARDVRWVAVRVSRDLGPGVEDRREGALMLAAVAAAAALAAPTLGDLPPLDLRGDSSCVVATGTPGELSVPWGEGVRFVSATRTGLQLGQTVTFGPQFRCGAIATRPNGAGVIVGELAGRLVAAVRDPGGAWGAPVELTEPESWFVEGTSAAVSERGDVVVAWSERRVTDATTRLRVARRAPGAGFGAPRRLGTSTRRPTKLQAAIAATGEAFVLTTTAPVNDRPPFRVPVTVFTAPPGGGFGPPLVIAESRWRSVPSLDVAADGRALIALSDGTSVRVAEREPGGTFGAAVPVGPAATVLSSPTVRLGAGGAAAVAWRSTLTGVGRVVTRVAPGPFSAPAVSTDASGPSLPAGWDPFYSSETYYAGLLGSDDELVLSGDPDDVALTPDGRAVFLLSHPAPNGEITPQLGTLPLAGGAVTTLAGAPVIGSSTSSTTLVLADGTPALAWTEFAGDAFTVASSLRFRLRVAAEGVAVAIDEPPVPTVKVGRPAQRRLGVEDSLRLPVTCSAACDVTATLDSQASVLFPLVAAVSLRKAGSGVLELEGAAIAATTQLRPVRVRILYGPRGTIRPRTRTVTVRIARAVDAKLPRLRSVSARRVGERIRVAFRIDGVEGDDLPLFVSGDDTRGWNGEPLTTQVVLGQEDERDYTLTLRGKDVKYVAVRLPLNIGPGSKVVTRVRP